MGPMSSIGYNPQKSVFHIGLSFYDAFQWCNIIIVAYHYKRSGLNTSQFCFVYFNEIVWNLVKNVFDPFFIYLLVTHPGQIFNICVR